MTEHRRPAKPQLELATEAVKGLEPPTKYTRSAGRQRQQRGEFRRQQCRQHRRLIRSPQQMAS
jgi:hypothetical protein